MQERLGNAEGLPFRRLLSPHGAVAFVVSLSARSEAWAVLRSLYLLPPGSSQPAGTGTWSPSLSCWPQGSLGVVLGSRPEHIEILPFPYLSNK